ncbi:YdcF family protein [Tropicibacter sp. R15_0]|uniref:YdcF family protein n=1 Tax=Tropicibacter sp. R15_0 TaxID=2821101 RepID=UPI001ADCE0DB|nr:YdcF family protein [Tropicibacter sp. R15_0]MBO9466797.1 YdcF family protein [Tropicibacter sp. R15_0]
MIRWSIRLSLTGLGLFLATYCAAYLWSRPALWSDIADAPKADVIICLGGGANPANGVIIGSSIHRAKTCADLYLAGKAPKIIFSGSNGHASAASVADQMAALAHEMGVPTSAMKTDPLARSTLQNAIFSRELMEDAQSSLLVSDAYHLPRSWLSFRWAGLSDLHLVPARDGQVLTTPDRGALTRETLAIWFNLLRLPVYEIGQLTGLGDPDFLLQ